VSLSTALHPQPCALAGRPGRGTALGYDRRSFHVIIPPAARVAKPYQPLCRIAGNFFRNEIRTLMCTRCQSVAWPLCTGTSAATKQISRKYISQHHLTRDPVSNCTRVTSIKSTTIFLSISNGRTASVCSMLQAATLNAVTSGLCVALCCVNGDPPAGERGLSLLDPDNPLLDPE
jgi:hypothetical protein